MIDDTHTHCNQSIILAAQLEHYIKATRRLYIAQLTMFTSDSHSSGKIHRCWVCQRPPWSSVWWKSTLSRQLLFRGGRRGGQGPLAGPLDSRSGEPGHRNYHILSKQPEPCGMQLTSCLILDVWTKLFCKECATHPCMHVHGCEFNDATFIIHVIAMARFMQISSTLLHEWLQIQ